MSKKYVWIVLGCFFFTLIAYFTLISMSRDTSSVQDVFSLEALSHAEDGSFGDGYVTYDDKTYQANYAVQTGEDGVRRIIIFAKEVSVEDMPKEN